MAVDPYMQPARDRVFAKARDVQQRLVDLDQAATDARMERAVLIDQAIQLGASYRMVADALGIHFTLVGQIRRAPLDTRTA